MIITMWWEQGMGPSHSYLNGGPPKLSNTSRFLLVPQRHEEFPIKAVWMWNDWKEKNVAPRIHETQFFRQSMPNGTNSNWSDKFIFMAGKTAFRQSKGIGTQVASRLKLLYVRRWSKHFFFKRKRNPVSVCLQVFLALETVCLFSASSFLFSFASSRSNKSEGTL